MRTTLAIDGDVFSIARQRAQRENISMGEALRANAQAHPSAPLRSKLLVLPVRDEVISTEHVRRLMNEEGI